MTHLLPRRLAAGGTLAAASLCALLLSGAAPAQARDRDRISDRDIERAEDACREIARDRGWRDVRTDVRDRDRDRDDDRVVVEVTGRRDGDERERRCTYNTRRNDADFEDQVGEREVDRAKEACRQVAENRDWRNVRTEVRDRDRDGRVIIDVSGRRRGDERERECRYNTRRQEAEFEDRD